VLELEITTTIKVWQGASSPFLFSKIYIVYIVSKKNASFVAGQLCSSERTSTGLSGPDYGKRRSIGVLNFEHGACKATDAAELCPADMNCISCAPETKPSGRVSVLVGVPAGQKSEDCFDSGTKI